MVELVLVNVKNKKKRKRYVVVVAGQRKRYVVVVVAAGQQKGGQGIIKLSHLFVLNKSKQRKKIDVHIKSIFFYFLLIIKQPKTHYKQPIINNPAPTHYKQPQPITNNPALIQTHKRQPFHSSDIISLHHFTCIIRNDIQSFV